jgi:ABC transport system ATP-binding/permease protein
VSFVDELVARAKALFQRPAPPEPLPPPAPAAAPVVDFLPPVAKAEPAPTAPAAEPEETVVATAEAQQEPAAELEAEPEPFEPVAPAEAATEVASAPAGGLVLRLNGERPEGPTFAVTRSGATIGRGPENTIQLSDLSVSRKHARIAYRQGAYWLSDVGSMGGTWVDGAKLAAPRRLAEGQAIDIGVCRLTVAAVDSSGKSSPPKGRSNGT